MNWIEVNEYTINKDNVDAIEVYGSELIFHMSGGQEITCHCDDNNDAMMWRSMFVTMAMHDADDPAVEKKLSDIVRNWHTLVTEDVE